MALDPCPYCPKEFDHDNAGARQNHIDNCPYNPENMPDSAKQAREGPQSRQPSQAQPPAQPQPNAQQAATPQPPATAQQQAQPPAVQGNEAVQTGLELGQTAQTLVGANRHELLQAAGAGLVSISQALEEQEKAARQRAEQVGDREIGQSDHYPRCEACNAQISKLPPPGEEFPCPGCGTMLRAP